MIDEDAAKRVESWIKAARKGGATLLAGGAREGNMLPATLLENVPHEADLYRKEAFDPPAGMESFDDFDDALARVQDSDFGLQAGVFTGRLAHTKPARDPHAVGGCTADAVPHFPLATTHYARLQTSGPP